MSVGDYFVADKNIVKVTEVSNPYGEHVILKGQRIAPDGNWDFFLFHGAEEFVKRAQKVTNPWSIMMLSFNL